MIVRRNNSQYTRKQKTQITSSVKNYFIPRQDKATVFTQHFNVKQFSARKFYCFTVLENPILFRFETMWIFYYSLSEICDWKNTLWLISWQKLIRSTSSTSWKQVASVCNCKFGLVNSTSTTFVMYINKVKVLNQSHYLMDTHLVCINMIRKATSHWTTLTSNLGY